MMRLSAVRVCRREILHFAVYGLPAWLGYCHLHERNEPPPENEPPPVHLSADLKTIGAGNVGGFQGGLKGDLSATVSLRSSTS